MSLLREIQDDAARTGAGVDSLLRKCKILAARLGSQDFATWIDLELNGYPVEQPVPDYRRLATGWWAQFINSAWRVDRAPIPEFIVPSEAREGFRKMEVREGIAAIEQFASGRGARIERPELAPSVEGKMYPGMNCFRVWSETHSNNFAQLLSAIRNRILDFVLRLEKENPDAGEAPINSRPIAEDKLQPIVNYFFGSTGNIAQSSHDVNQTANLGVRAGDLDSLKGFLLSRGLEDQDVKELERAVRDDQNTVDANTSPGPRVRDWIARLAIRVGDTAGDIGKAVLVQVAAAAIKSYYLGIR